MSLFAASPAVMATRAPELVEADDAERALWRKLDFYPTPPWAARAGLELIRSLDPDATDLWEPACGRGHIAGPLRELGCSVQATDIHPFGFGEVHDFLGGLPVALSWARPPAWVVTNPPFRHAAAFIQRGLEVATMGVAILARLSFMEAACRYKLVFSGATPVSVVAPFIERVPIQLGSYDPRLSTATAYAWFVWRKGERFGAAPELRPIPPGTRARLTRPDDARRWGRLAGASLLDEVADG